eukprot:8481006-Pyramimonas_sp.AAC.1
MNPPTGHNKIAAKLRHKMLLASVLCSFSLVSASTSASAPKRNHSENGPRNRQNTVWAEHW